MLNLNMNKKKEKEKEERVVMESKKPFSADWMTMMRSQTSQPKWLRFRRETSVSYI